MLYGGLLRRVAYVPLIVAEFGMWNIRAFGMLVSISFVIARHLSRLVHSASLLN